ncbi:MAG TPA: nitroreductase family protein [Halanaerobiales bacterium]|nr:nitroreductase family protein [Halanaerobiales bacterium]
MLENLVKKNRSYRKFKEQKGISNKIIKDIINLARLSPSSANKQPLKYIILNKKDDTKKIFPHLNWAGYLKDWDGPVKGERPAAYILVLGDQNISNNFETDAGIAMQTILLGATEKNINGCILGSINREAIRSIYNIEKKHRLLYVIALGMPAEEIKIENLPTDGDIKYWRDENGIHHVPKRELDNIIINT